MNVSTSGLRSGLVLAVCSLALSVSAETRDRNLLPEELAERADTVVVARVVRQEPRWIDRALYTYVELEADTWIKGEERESIALLVPGGRAEMPGARIRIAEVRAGAPALLAKTQGVFFLTHTAGAPASAGPARRLVEGTQGFMPVFEVQGQARVEVPMLPEPMSVRALTRRLRRSAEPQR